ncbi:MAG: ImmA/IrrE family metallo-endopeptidase [Bdellovibrionota bacterium]
MNSAPIYKDPEDLLLDLGITKPEEIDLLSIAQFCNAHVVVQPLNGIEGRIIGNASEAFITVNANSSPERQRFSIGHELGHWMYDRGKPFFNCASSDFKKWGIRELDPEVRANKYSANLIMPTSMFVPMTRREPINFATVKKLMSIFNSTLMATAIRLVEQGPYPSMLVCTVAGKRKWFCRNKVLPTFVWPIENLCMDSFAAELLKGLQKSANGTVGADSWVTLKGSEDYLVFEDSIKIGNKTILSIIWWKDESQISALV